VNDLRDLRTRKGKCKVGLQCFRNNHDGHHRVNLGAPEPDDFEDCTGQSGIGPSQFPCDELRVATGEPVWGSSVLASPLNAVARASRRQSRYGRVSPLWPNKNFNFGIKLEDPAEDETQSMCCCLHRPSQTLPLPESLRAEFELGDGGGSP
jgi:hypothetical protein